MKKKYVKPEIIIDEMVINSLAATDHTPSNMQLCGDSSYQAQCSMCVSKP